MDKECVVERMEVYMIKSGRKYNSKLERSITIKQNIRLKVVVSVEGEKRIKTCVVSLLELLDDTPLKTVAFFTRKTLGDIFEGEDTNEWEKRLMGHCTVRKGSVLKLKEDTPWIHPHHLFKTDRVFKAPMRSQLQK